MKGLQITRPGHFEMVDVAPEAPYPDEVVVEVKAINSCTHWDLTVWDGVDIFGRQGHPRYPYYVGGPGHEWSGVVVQRGPQVTSLKGGRPGGLLGQPARACAGCAPRGRATGATWSTSPSTSVRCFPLTAPARRRGGLAAALDWPELAMLEMLSCVTQGVVAAATSPGSAWPSPGWARRG